MEVMKGAGLTVGGFYAHYDSKEDLFVETLRNAANTNWDHLLNWRLYRKYSRGLLAELGSHQVAIANWFFGGPPEAAYASGGTYQYKDGREVQDHIFVTWDYPGGRTSTFTSIQSSDRS